MCGLVGLYSSNFFARHKQCLESLLYLDTWRGRDSTGVAAVRHNADTAILKSTVPGYEFIEGNKLDQHLRLNDFCWIGHNRYGTVGRNIKTNAHPFSILDEQGSCMIVGAHNGTLKNKHALKEHVQFGTDSEALFYNIALSSIEEVIPQLEGAWALSWYDHAAEELRFLRNKERPLFYAWEEDRKTIMWASEQWMLRIAASRAGIKLFEDKVYDFTEDNLYTFPAPEKMNQELELVRKGAVVGREPAAFFRPHHGSGWWENGTWRAAGSGTGGADAKRPTTQPQTTPQASQTRAGNPQTSPIVSSASGTPTTAAGGQPQTKSEPSSNTPPSSEFDDNVVQIANGKRYKNFAGKLMSKRQLEEVLDAGCAWCELEHIAVTDRFAWLSMDKPVCSKCLHGHQDAPKLPLEVGVTVH